MLPQAEKALVLRRLLYLISTSCGWQEQGFWQVKDVWQLECVWWLSCDAMYS